MKKSGVIGAPVQRSVGEAASKRPKKRVRPVSAATTGSDASLDHRFQNDLLTQVKIELEKKIQNLKQQILKSNETFIPTLRKAMQCDRLLSELSDAKKREAALTAQLNGLTKCFRKMQLQLKNATEEVCKYQDQIQQQENTLQEIKAENLKLKKALRSAQASNPVPSESGMFTSSLPQKGDEFDLEVPRFQTDEGAAPLEALFPELPEGMG